MGTTNWTISGVIRWSESNMPEAASQLTIGHALRRSDDQTSGSKGIDRVNVSCTFNVESSTWRTCLNATPNWEFNAQRRPNSWANRNDRAWCSASFGGRLHVSSACASPRNSSRARRGFNCPVRPIDVTFSSPLCIVVDTDTVGLVGRDKAVHRCLVWRV
jgi:hypothetical protein